jgi:protoheme IX farnesyltransferase
LLALSLFVMAWGAFVRAMGASQACGGDWPLCQGQLAPFGFGPEVWLDWAHRASSGLLVLLGVVVALWGWRAGGFARACAGAAMVALGVAVLVGALVATGWGGPGTRLALSVGHAGGAFLLLAAVTGLAWASSHGGAALPRGDGHAAALTGLGLGGVLLMACAGSVAAMGGEGLVTAGGEPLLDRWRAATPLLNVSIGVLVAVCAAMIAQRRDSPATRRLAVWVQTFVAAHLALGLVAALAPGQGWTYVAAFAVTLALWVAVVALGLEAPRAAPLPSPSRPRARARLRELPGLYLAVTKPRVVSLLLFTTLTAAFIAAAGWPGGWLLLALSLGGYGMAGAANAINMVVDRDIDVRMARTADRPTVDGRLSGAHTILFAVALAGASFAVLAFGANLLAATLSLAGLAFYIVVYTLLLKRRTWHNIVLGGAAGAFPPLVGFAAVAGEVGPLAWTLFAIIFFWTPVHFWALALMIRDEYAGVGVPMLPVVRGERATVIQIAAYAVLTIALSLLPLFQGQASPLYLALAVLLNAVLIARVAGLVRVPDRPRAVALFKYSMLYLALLFLVAAMDRSLV